MNRPRVLLLGPNGQLGSDVRHAHATAGEPWDLVPIGRDRLDVAAAQALEHHLAKERFDVLVNCTGYHNTDDAEDDATTAFAINAHAVRAMAKACARQKARLLHISTDYVFGGDAHRREPLRETSPTAPVNVYGASKALGETFAFAELEAVLVFRVASLFGVHGARAKGGNFVETMIRLGHSRRDLRVVDDQVMSPTATGDIARIILRAVSTEHRGVFHVVNRGSASWFDFAKQIVRKAGVNAEVTPCSSLENPRRAMRPRYSALDNAKAEAAFGPLSPWQDALARYLRAKGHIRSAAY